MQVEGSRKWTAQKYFLYRKYFCSGEDINCKPLDQMRRETRTFWGKKDYIVWLLSYNMQYTIFTFFRICTAKIKKKIAYMLRHVCLLI
jgi:hypothetical protein